MPSLVACDLWSVQGGPTPAKLGKARGLLADPCVPAASGPRPFAVVTWGLTAAEEASGQGHWLWALGPLLLLTARSSSNAENPARGGGPGSSWAVVHVPEAGQGGIGSDGVPRGRLPGCAFSVPTACPR